MKERLKISEGIITKLILIAIFLFCFFNFEDMITVERIQETRAKTKPLTVFLYWLGKSEIGYYVGKSIFLAIPLYIIWRWIKNARN